MNKSKLLFLSFLSGALFAGSWPPYGLTLFIFIALAPLLYVENYIATNKEKFSSSFLFLCCYFAFFTWNLISTWWIYNASPEGAVMAVLASSLFLSFPFYFFHIVKQRIVAHLPAFQKTSILLLIPIWISFEYLYLHWDLSYPWLMLGNAFGKEYKWIQWYEYTGTLGGSFWILAVNILALDLFYALKNDRAKGAYGKAFRKKIVFMISLIFLPILISYMIYTNYEEKSNPVNVVIVQPNIDPYSEKFFAPFEEQLYKMLSLAETKIDSLTDFVVFPETAITENMWENQLENTGSVIALQNFLKKYPGLKIVTGASTAYQYEPGEAHSPTAKKFRKEDIYYEDYNTALQVDTASVQKYHKSKLVPGVEKMPFPQLLKPLENYAIDLGGTSGSLTGQEERTVFVSTNNTDTFKVAPVICYESVYGEFIGEYVNNGANMIFIITNDGWWGNTQGYKQHLVYGRLRAIESRRPIARSANTGISCAINQQGDILFPTSWWEPAVIKCSINANNEKTFYTLHGDYIARFSLWLSAGAFFYYLLLRLRIIKKTV